MHVSLIFIAEVDCGNPASVAHADVSYTNTRYQDTAIYTCQSGYSLDASDHTDNTVTVNCQANKAWSSTPTCTGKI